MEIWAQQHPSRGLKYAPANEMILHVDMFRLGVELVIVCKCYRHLIRILPSTGNVLYHVFLTRCCVDIGQSAVDSRYVCIHTANLFLCALPSLGLQACRTHPETVHHGIAMALQPPADKPILPTWRTRALSVLTVLAHGFAPFITTFLFVHLASPT